MLTFRVETPSWIYDRETGRVSDVIWTDSGMTFPSPYSATQYARPLLGRVVDEETDAEPASGGVVSWRNWVLKAEWVKGNPIVVEVKATDNTPPGCGCSLVR